MDPAGAPLLLANLGERVIANALTGADERRTSALDPAGDEKPANHQMSPSGKVAQSRLQNYASLYQDARVPSWLHRGSGVR